MITTFVDMFHNFFYLKAAGPVHSGDEGMITAADLNQSGPSQDGEGINANEIILSGFCDDGGVFKPSEANKSGPCVDRVGIIANTINQTDGEVIIASEINQSGLCEDSDAITANGSCVEDKVITLSSSDKDDTMIKVCIYLKI